MRDKVQFLELEDFKVDISWATFDKPPFQLKLPTNLQPTMLEGYKAIDNVYSRYFLSFSAEMFFSKANIVFNKIDFFDEPLDSFDDLFNDNSMDSDEYAKYSFIEKTAPFILFTIMGEDKYLDFYYSFCANNDIEYNANTIVQDMENIKSSLKSEDFERLEWQVLF